MKSLASIFDSTQDLKGGLAPDDESAEKIKHVRMKSLASIFDSTQTRVINWQCQLIKLLKGGLAPDAEADLIVSSGIPIGPCREFLKKLNSVGVTV